MIRLLLNTERLEDEIPGISRAIAGMIYSVFILRGRQVKIVYEGEYDIAISDKPIPDGIYIDRLERASVREIYKQFLGLSLAISFLKPARIFDFGKPLRAYTYITNIPSKGDLVYEMQKNLVRVIYFVSRSTPREILPEIDELVRKYPDRELKDRLPEYLGEIPLVIVYFYK